MKNIDIKTMLHVVSYSTIDKSISEEEFNELAFSLNHPMESLTEHLIIIETGVFAALKI